MRKITVGNQRFGWSATGNDDFISLAVAPLHTEGQLLTTAFGYHSVLVSGSKVEDGSVVQHLRQQTLVTPGIVRQVIDYALAHGWQPYEKKGQFYLPGIEKYIDLRLGKKTRN